MRDGWAIPCAVTTADEASGAPGSSSQEIHHLSLVAAGEDEQGRKLAEPYLSALLRVMALLEDSGWRVTVEGVEGQQDEEA